MDELRRLAALHRPGEAYWIAYWLLREKLTISFGSEGAAVEAIKEGLRRRRAA